MSRLPQKSPFTAKDFAGQSFYYELTSGEILATISMAADGTVEGVRHKSIRRWRVNESGVLEIFDRWNRSTGSFSATDSSGVVLTGFSSRMNTPHRLRRVKTIAQAFTGIKLKLPDVTLVCADCYDLNRAIAAVEISRHFCDFGDVKLFTSIPTDYAFRVAIPKLASTRDYSRFMLLDLEKYIQTKYLLVVQHDGFVCNPAAWSDEWYDYDYVGGKVPYGVEFWRGVQHGGCGGFSFRTSRLQRFIAEHCDWNAIDPYYHHEDYVICVTFGYQLGRNGFKLLASDLAREKFSGEEHLPYLGQFGHHKGDLSTWQLKPRLA